MQARHLYAGGALLLSTAFANMAAAQETPRPAILADLAVATTLVDITHTGERLVAVGQRGHILHSDDGKSWTQVVSPHNAMLNRVRFRNERMGWAVGHDNTIAATTDGGDSWSLQHFDPEGRGLNDIIILRSGKLIAVGGYGAYLESDDDGASWIAGENNLSELGYHLNAGLELKDGSIMVVGERSLMGRSLDQGASWVVIDSPYEGSLFGMLPMGESGVLAYGMRGNVYISDDISATRSMDPLDFDPFAKQTVEDPEELNKMGWRQIPAVTIESLFGGTWRGNTALLVGVNGTAVQVDPEAGRMQLVETPADETLGDAIWANDQWIAVGRRGVQPLGPLVWN